VTQNLNMRQIITKSVACHLTDEQKQNWVSVCVRTFRKHFGNNHNSFPSSSEVRKHEFIGVVFKQSNRLHSGRVHPSSLCPKVATEICSSVERLLLILFFSTDGIVYQEGQTVIVEKMAVEYTYNLILQQLFSNLLN
jgi:hypothetical protein